MDRQRLSLPWIEQRLGQLNPRSIPSNIAGRRAAVAIIISHDDALDQPLRLMFIRRAEHEQDPWSGHMAFPGGRVEPEDATTQSAAQRETLEEVGVDLAHDARVLGSLDDLPASAGGRVLPLAISPYVYLLRRQVSTTPNAEVEEVHWISVETLLAPQSCSTTPYTLRGHRFELPCLRVHERVIWGLTYQMLMRLFTVLKWG